MLDYICLSPFLQQCCKKRVYHINPAVTPLSENTAPLKPKLSHRPKRNLHTVRPNIAVYLWTGCQI